MANPREIALDASWLVPLGEEFDQLYMRQLRQFLVAEKSAGKTIFPRGDQFFAALNQTPLSAVKVVVLGQDPYHGDGQAHGLSFSVLPGVRVPPSLQNIYRELASDTGFTAPEHGFLKPWADQGVLLLNSVLSVERGLAASHQGQGWERFTDAVIRTVNEHCEGVVFMLWGSYAQKKGAMVDQRKHCVLKAPHPSPLSAHRGFLGCGHFSKANAYLKQQGKTPIDWQLPFEVKAGGV